MCVKMQDAGELIKWKSYVDKNKELLKTAKQLQNTKRPVVGNRNWNCIFDNCIGAIKEFFDN